MSAALNLFLNSLCFSLGDKSVVYNWRRSKILILRFFVDILPLYFFNIFVIDFSSSKY